MAGSGGLGALLKTLRPHQWVKNIFVLAPIVFHKDVFIHTPLGPALNLIVTGRAAAATGVFCLLAGAVYTINDLVDVDADRVHPIKRERPIASGLVSEGAARALAVALVVLSIGLAYWLAPALALVACLYFAENLAYSFKLKKIAFLDVGLIAFGFVLRVLAGGIATRRPRLGIHARLHGLAGPVPAASANAGTSSRWRTPASSAQPWRRTRRGPSRSPSPLPVRLRP